MRTKRRRGIARALWALVLLGGCLSAAVPAAAYSILHRFAGGVSDGAFPTASLIWDGADNLYGTTSVGGSAACGGTGCGTVFTLKTNGTGFTILHTFTGGASDGQYPLAALILDTAGSLYGTTERGGSADRGTVFTLKTDGTGFTILHTFTGGASDGYQPYASLILDTAGSLYGTTTRGGSVDRGTVFTLATDGTGFTILHSFVGSPSDGTRLVAPLILDGAGNLYGTTESGGSGGGTVFTLASDGTGFTILHSFAGGASDGVTPEAALILDAAGNLYGTTSGGGSSSRGTVFTLATDGTGFTILHSFAGGFADGQYPLAALILDAAGSLYGTTSDGGSSGRGTVFTLAIDGTGFTILHSFAGGFADGQSPQAALILDAAGNLYGTTEYGGGGGGTVFMLP